MPRTRAVQAAEQIITRHKLERLPVNIRDVAREYASILTDPLPPDVSGMLVPASDQSAKKWIIIVNKRHGIERQRFTIGHELAHLLLHNYTAPHADGTKQIRYRNALSSLGTEQEEIEANQFAAEVLLPAKLLIPRLQNLGLISWDGEVPAKLSEAIADLAAECKVSLQALLLRIGNLLQHG